MKSPAPGICGNCEFRTKRILACEWHSNSFVAENAEDLASIVADMLSESVTRSLPVSWQGAYSVERARFWIDERDEEGTTLIVVDHHEGQPIGLIILFETDAPSQSTGTEVRIGYLLAEKAWGKGFGTEMLNGLVEWCREQPEIYSLVGGVDRDNVPSQIVLEKCGFRIAESGEDHEFYQLIFHR